MDLASAQMERMLIKGLISGGTLHTTITGEIFLHYRPIYDAIEELKAVKKTVNYANLFTKVDISALNECVQSEGYAAMVDDYANTLNDLCKRRKILAALQQAEVDIQQDETSSVIDTLREVLVHSDDSSGNMWQGISSVMTATRQYLDEQQIFKKGENCFLFRLQHLDALTGGLYPGEMTVIGARPAVGKSAFALHIAYNIALKGGSVGILSREMSDTQFGTRLLAKASGINGMKFRTGTLTDDELKDIAATSDILSQLDLNFLFKIRTVEDLYRQVLTRAEIKPLDILIVDYLQLMDTTKSVGSDHLRVGAISRGLKDIALDFKIPVIALAQVNRDADNAMPTLGKLKDSGSIEQDADNVIFMYAPESPDNQFVHPDDKGSFDAWAKRGMQYIVFNVAKQRQGTIGKVPVLFDRAHMDYITIER